MQQNRESSSMDRRKAELSEPGLNDIKDQKMLLGPFKIPLNGKSPILGQFRAKPFRNKRKRLTTSGDAKCF